MGLRRVAWPGPTTSRQLMVDLGQDEGLYGRVTLRSAVPQCGVPRRGLCSSPLTALGTWRERTFCPLPPSHGSFPRCRRQGRESRQEQSWRKTTCEPVRSCRGEHQTAQKVPCSPHEAVRQRVPSLTGDGKPSSKHSFATPRRLQPPPWVRNVLRRKKPEV